jgi:hypothetical protein
MKSLTGAALTAAVLLGAPSSFAQDRPQGRPAPPAHAKAAAPIDLTGQWVSVVTEDWRWRMVTPPKGDVASVPLNDAGRAKANAWDLAADNAAGNQCAAFGAGGIIRMPMRMRISWQDDDTLKLETDAGQQTQLLKFVTPAPAPIDPALLVASPAPAQRTWQGESKAQWFRQGQAAGFQVGLFPSQVLPGGALRVVTRNMRAGYLRKNGVPYSENAVITQHYIRYNEPNGSEWITVTTIVEDPQYLRQPFLTSTSFKKETDMSKWAPTPCHTPPPFGQSAVGRPTDPATAD